MRIYVCAYIHIYGFIQSYAFPRAHSAMPLPSRENGHTASSTQPPAAGSGLGTRGYRLGCARPSPGLPPAPCLDSRVLWRGAPCPAAAELRRRHRGAAKCLRQGLPGQPREGRRTVRRTAHGAGSQLRAGESAGFGMVGFF